MTNSSTFCCLLFRENIDPPRYFFFFDWLEAATPSSFPSSSPKTNKNTAKQKNNKKPRPRNEPLHIGSSYHLKLKCLQGLLEGIYCFLVPRELNQDYICDFFPPFSYVYF